MPRLARVRYAVTGATGFVGGHLVRLLREESHEVVALVRESSRAAGPAAQGAELVEGDLDDFPALDRLLDGADGLFHVAGWYAVGAPPGPQAHRVNVVGTAHVLAAAAKAGVARVVHTSTLAVNSDTRGAVRDETYVHTGAHISAYDASKAEAQRVALRFAAEGLPLVVVMPGMVYGPGDTSQAGALLRDVLAGRRAVVTSTGAYCWGYVEDIARGHLLAMTTGTTGETYMLAGPVHTLAHALRLGARLGAGRPPVVIPGAVARALAPVAERLERVVPEGYRAEALRSGAATYLGSPAKAGRDLGWSARPLAEGMALTVAAVREGAEAAR